MEVTMSLFNKLKNLDTTTDNEDILIQYILNNTEQFLTDKPKDIAEKNFVSVATLYRLLEKMGYNGLTEFKIDLAGHLKPKQTKKVPVDSNYPIKENDSFKEMSENLMDLYMQSAIETENLNDYLSFSKIVPLIKQATKTTIYSNSSNIAFAENFAYQMLEFGYTVHVPKDDFSQSIHAANSTGNDFSIVISYGGRSKNLYKIMEILKGNQCHILLITSTQKNPLIKYADSILYIASSEHHYDKISSFSSRFSLLFILDMIFSSIFNTDYQKHIEFKKKNYAKINRNLE